jgi:sugar/nucleoside kinase (ribokinase family)
MEGPAAELVKKLSALQKQGKPKKVLAGFDGFIDTIAKPVCKAGNETEKPVYFDSIQEFGNYISAHSHKSASIELDIIDRRMGGNTPNFARGIAALGLTPFCIGMFSDGRGNFDPVFLTLPGEKMFYAPAGTATALEFNDGKIFFSPRYTLSASPWELIETAYRSFFPKGQTLENLLQAFDLIACLNWSETAFTDELWKNFLEKCASLFSRDKKKYLLFDLCDFSRKTAGELESVLSLIERLSPYRTTILSLNRNEALLLEERLIKKNSVKKDAAELKGIAKTICDRYTIDEVLIHAHHESCAAAQEGVFSVRTRRLASPKISTGAGDNFNAAYAFAALYGLPFTERLRFANFYASAYILSGINQNMDGLWSLNGQYDRK